MVVVDRVERVGDGGTVITAIVSERRERLGANRSFADCPVELAAIGSGSDCRRPTATTSSLPSAVPTVRRSTRTTSRACDGRPVRRAARTFCGRHSGDRSEAPECSYWDPTSTELFTTRDPLDGVNGTTTVANPYHYTDNDPINKVDPTGMRPNEDEKRCAETTADRSGSEHREECRKAIAVLNRIYPSWRIYTFKLSMCPKPSETGSWIFARQNEPTAAYTDKAGDICTNHQVAKSDEEFDYFVIHELGHKVLNERLIALGYEGVGDYKAWVRNFAPGNGPPIVASGTLNLQDQIWAGFNRIESEKPMLYSPEEFIVDCISESILGKPKANYWRRYMPMIYHCTAAGLEVGRKLVNNERR